MDDKIINTQTFQEALKTEINKCKKISETVNEKKIQNVLYVCEVMKKLTKPLKAKVKYTLNKDFKGVGIVSVNAKHLEFTDYESFNDAARLANNFEAYAKNDGTVQMNFTFYHLLDKE